MDQMFSCATCDHPATEHGWSGCALCSCVNPLEAIAESRSDVVPDTELRSELESTDERRSA